MKELNLLINRLTDYTGQDYYPFHMPGHKRQIVNPFAIDITEIYGFDNLHHAEGIIKDSMVWAADCYGSDESCYLINGSSAGILSAISGCTSRRGKILLGRNCHMSAYHGVMLSELEVEYVYPQFMEDLGIQGGILPEDVENKLIQHSDIQAVLIVSPTYDGIVSDIRRIADIVHQHGRLLIVDEAHGAHFSFGKEGEFPVSALQKGADVVIQSLHKTLPSLTQTAILHMKKKHLGQDKMNRIKQYLSIYQSSSPSYVFMAAIENCIWYMEQEGRKRLSQFAAEIQIVREQGRKLKVIQIPGREWIGRAGIYDMDLSKIIMVTGFGKRNGKWLAAFLRKNYHLELEMCSLQYALAITSLCDQKEGFIRLMEGLLHADHILEKETNHHYFSVKSKTFPKSVCKISEAMEGAYESCPLAECKGRISAEFVSVYPPGIPFLVPGEIVSEEILFEINNDIKRGFSIHGMEDFHGKQLKVLKFPSKSK